MDSWLTYPEYLAQHPGSALTEAAFTPRAVDATFFIESATRWCASLAKEPEQLALLAQVRLVLEVVRVDAHALLEHVDARLQAPDGFILCHSMTSFRDLLLFFIIQENEGADNRAAPSAFPQPAVVY